MFVDMNIISAFLVKKSSAILVWWRQRRRSGYHTSHAARKGGGGSVWSWRNRGGGDQRGFHVRFSLKTDALLLFWGGDAMSDAASRFSQHKIELLLYF